MTTAVNHKLILTTFLANILIAGCQAIAPNADSQNNPNPQNSSAASDKASTNPDKDLVMEARAQAFATDPAVVSSIDWYEPTLQINGIGSDAKGWAEAMKAPATNIDFSAANDIAEASGAHALLVYKDGKLLHEKFWQDNDGYTLQLTYSFHKTVSAIMLGIAIDKGYINTIEQPLSDFLTEWQGLEKGNITLRQVAQMSSGFSHPSFDGGLYSTANQFYFGTALEQFILNFEPKTTPDTVFDYGNLNAQIMGVVLNRAFPQGYSEALNDYLWQPLKANTANIRLDTEGGTPITYCCLNAGAYDWLKFGLLIKNKGQLNGQKIISQDFFKLLETAAKTNPNYGLFTWLGSPYTAKRYYSETLATAFVESAQPFADDDVVFLDGAGGQRIYVSRQADLVIVRIGKMDRQWDDTQLFNAVVKVLP